METRECQNCHNKFNIEPDDFSFYEKINVPAPTWCPECRIQRRLILRNERNLYHRKCNLCNKSIVSMYSQKKEFPVYCHDCWWSDKWNPIEMGQEYDFSKSFFEQIEELKHVVPHLALINTNSTDSEYTNYAGNNKNCYLVFSNATGKNENCGYSTGIRNCHESYDMINTYDSELINEAIDCQKCYHSSNINNCFDCSESYFCEDLKNCTYCIGCKGLRNRHYFIFNQQYTKEEYFLKNKELKLDTFWGYKDVKEKFWAMRKKLPNRYAHNIKTENSSGDYIVNSRNSQICFDTNDTLNSKFLKYSVKQDIDCYDCCYVTESELGYENHSLVNSHNCHFNNVVWWNVSNLRYTELVFTSSNLFACIGLRNKSYCILNRQYTKEQYEALVPKIIKHMNDMPYIDSKGRIYKYGEFFPSELSPFCYNETIAQEYFPLTKEQAISQGYRWKDKEERNYQIDIKNEDIPDDINDVSEDITDKVIECAHKDCNHQCTEVFKVIPEELQFYKRMNLPLPHLCPNCRHYERLSQRNPMKLWHRSCMKEGCSNEFETSYAPERPEIIYCEKCYQQEVY